MRFIQNVTCVLASLLILTGCESTSQTISSISNSVQSTVQDINFDRAIPSFLQSDGENKGGIEDNMMMASDSQGTEVDCPAVINIDDLSALHEFINDETPRAGNAVSQVQITDIRSKCTRKKSNIIVEMEIDFVGNKGPQSDSWNTAGHDFSYPYFMAITSSNSDIIAKEIFTLSMDYDRGQRTATHTESLRQIMPAYGNLGAAAHSIIIGFQLTDSQLAYNRSLLSAAKHKTAALSALNDAMQPSGVYTPPAPIVTNMRAPQAPPLRPAAPKQIAAVPDKKPTSIMARHGIADDTFEDITAGRSTPQTQTAPVKTTPEKAEIAPPPFDIIEPEIVITP